MAVTNISPNADNYYIGRGIVSWKPDGGAWRDVGNAPALQIKAAIKNLDHFSSRQGLKVKDRSIAIEANATVIIKLDEWTADNIALALMSEEGTTIEILSKSELVGSIFFLGTNDIGAKFSVLLPKVSLTPTGTLDFISADKYGEIELTGDVLAADPAVASLGTAEWNTAATAPP